MKSGPLFLLGHRIRIFLSVFPLFFGGCATSESLILSVFYELNSPRIPWEQYKKHKTGNLVIYADPGIPESALLRSARQALDHQETLRKTFFKSWNQKEIRLVVYRDYKSYAKHKPTPFDTGAHYEGLSRTVYIPISSPPAIWRHELMHAVLETTRPGSPYWLHEGLAYFLQMQPFPEPVTCEAGFLAAMPQGFSVFIEELRYREDLRPGNSFDLTREGEPELNAVLSTYFVFFLWHKGILQKSLETYLSGHRIRMEFILTGGNSASWDALSAEFRKWLQSDLPLKALPGC